jgi:hypothetical protein
MISKTRYKIKYKMDENRGMSRRQLLDGLKKIKKFWNLKRKR